MARARHNSNPKRAPLESVVHNLVYHRPRKGRQSYFHYVDSFVTFREAVK